MDLGSSFLGGGAFCCIEVLALVVYAEVVRPEVKRSCLAAAAGCTVFMFLNRMEGFVAGLAMGTVVVLAAPVAWRIDGVKGDVDMQQGISGMLLMLVMVKRVFFDS